MILYVCLFAVVIYSSQSPDEVVFTYTSADWEAEINHPTTPSDPEFNRAHGWHYGDEWSDYKAAPAVGFLYFEVIL